MKSMEELHHLPIERGAPGETGCCPRFQPEGWDGKIFNLEGLPMIKVSARSILYIPWNIGGVMRRSMERIAAAGMEDPERYLVLARDLSPWQCEYYFLTKGPVPEEENILLKGRFLSKVYEGDYSAMRGWMKEMDQHVRELGYGLRSTYAFYTTCPKCAKAYGKNYVVLLGELDEVQC